MSEIIKKIQELDGEQFDLFARNLIDECDRNSLNQQVIGMGYTKLNEGFIGFKTKISYGSGYDYNYSMKDYEMYIDFLKILKNKYTESSNINLSDLIDDVYIYIRNYFKSEKEVIKDPDFSSVRDQIITEYLESITKNPDDTDEWLKNKNELSINAFKGKGVAMCSERTALAQNLLSLLGVQSFYCSGVIKNESEEECTGHAFNILRNNEKYYIVDFSAPVRVYKDGNLYSALPYVAEIDDDKVDSLLNDKYAVKFLNYEYDISSEIPEKRYTEDNRIYGVGLIEINENRIMR